MYIYTIHTNQSFSFPKKKKKRNLSKSLANNNPTKVHPEETERKFRNNFLLIFVFLNNRLSPIH
jgi:hypothetical protein